MNKLYLKVGVALTAAFAFGYLVGTELAIRKMREIAGEQADDMKLVKDELVYQAEHKEDISEEVPKELEQKEEDEMARRKAAKKQNEMQSFHYDIPYQMVTEETGRVLDTRAEDWATVENIAAHRIEKLIDILTEEDGPSLIKAAMRIQDQNTPMMIRDTTIYPMNKAMRHIRFVYVQSSSRLYWRIGSWRDGIEPEEIEDILVRLMTFSVTRKKSDDNQFVVPTTWTPALLMTEGEILPNDDPELYDTRIFTLFDLGIEVEIMIEPSEPYPGRIDALLEAHVEE